MIGIALFTVVLASFVGWMIAQRIGRPLVALHRDAQVARQGNVELMDDLQSGYREIDDTHEILRAFAAERRGLAPAKPRGGPGG